MNVLGSKAASRVLFRLTLGPKEPLKIATELRISPSAVVQQLNELSRHDPPLVKREEKEGKNQPYSIEWKNLSKTFAQNLPAMSNIDESGLHSRDRDVRRATRWDAEWRDKLIERLANNPVFGELVEAYIVELVFLGEFEEQEGASGNRAHAATLEEVTQWFEEAIVETIQLVNEPQTRKKDLHDLYQDFHGLVSFSHEVDTPPRLALKTAMGRIGLGNFD